MIRHVFLILFYSLGLCLFISSDALAFVPDIAGKITKILNGGTTGKSCLDMYPMGYTAGMVYCFSQISTVTVDFMSYIGGQLQPIGFAVVVLAFVHYGVRLTFGAIRNPKAEFYTLMFKAAFVIIVGEILTSVILNSVYLLTFINLPFELMKVVNIGSVLSTVKPVDYVKFGCAVPAAVFNGDNAFIAPYAQLDCLIGYFFGISGASLALSAGLFGILVPMLFSGPLGISVFMMILMLFWSFFRMMFASMYYMINAIIAIMLLMLVLPLVLPTIMFKTSSRYFQNWYKQLIAISFQPMIVAIVTVMAVSAMSNILTSNTMTGQSLTSVLGWDAVSSFIERAIVNIERFEKLPIFKSTTNRNDKNALENEAKGNAAYTTKQFIDKHTSQSSRHDFGLRAYAGALTLTEESDVSTPPPGGCFYYVWSPGEPLGAPMKEVPLLETDGKTQQTDPNTGALKFTKVPVDDKGNELTATSPYPGPSIYKGEAPLKVKPAEVPHYRIETASCVASKAIAYYNANYKSKISMFKSYLAGLLQNIFIPLASAFLAALIFSRIFRHVPDMAKQITGVSSMVLGQGMHRWSGAKGSDGGMLGESMVQTALSGWAKQAGIKYSNYAAEGKAKGIAPRTIVRRGTYTAKALFFGGIQGAAGAFSERANLKNTKAKNPKKQHMANNKNNLDKNTDNKKR